MAAGVARRVLSVCRSHRFEVVVVEKEPLPYFPAVLEHGVAAYDGIYYSRAEGGWDG